MASRVTPKTFKEKVSLKGGERAEKEGGGRSRTKKGKRRKGGRTTGEGGTGRKEGGILVFSQPNTWGG